MSQGACGHTSPHHYLSGYVRMGSPVERGSAWADDQLVEKGPVSAPRASVVIALYNGESTIGEQLDALSSQTCTEFEVVVADNGSTDKGPAIVKGHSVGARLVDASERRGQSHARNVGASAARSEKLLFCDQDDVADRRWVAALTDALDDWHLVGGLCEVRTLNGPRAGWRPQPVRPDLGLPLRAASGSNMGIRRRVLYELGGWPEDYIGGGEDNALCWRARLNGFTLGYREDAVMHYRYRSDLWSHTRQQYQYGRQTARLRAAFPEMDPSTVVPFYRSAGWLALHVHLLLSQRTSGWWLTIAGRALGGAIGARSPLPGRALRGDRSPDK